MALATTRRWFGPAARPFWGLAVVVMVELILFVGYHAQRWSKGLARRQHPQVQSGEGLVIRCDGLGYYAWLRSLLVDGDCSFDNEFDDHNPLGDAVPAQAARTRQGLRSNHWSVGPACVWAVTVVPVHLGLAACEGSGNTGPWSGYELPYQIAVGITTVLVSFLGLAFQYGICRHYARPSRAALAAALLTLGSTIVFYSAVEVAMAHGLGAAAVSGLVWYWLHSYGSCRPGRWLLVGILVGVAALMRWQLVTFAVLPASECLLACRQRDGFPGRRLALMCLAGLGAFAAFLPQMLAWRAVYGSWFVTPLAASHNWLSPSWWQVLASSDRGLFYWTPLALLALVGACLGCRRRAEGKSAGSVPDAKLQTQRLLLAAFALQVYVVASLWGEEVQLGVSFGFRHLTESLAALAGGLALLLERASRRWFRVLAGLGCLLVLWNLLLIGQYRYGLVPAAAGEEPGTLLANALWLVRRKKLLLLGPVMAGPLLLWLLLGRANERCRAPGRPHLPACPAPRL